MEKNMTYSDSIEKQDEEYRKRTAHLDNAKGWKYKGGREKAEHNKGLCLWCGQKKAFNIGLCKACRGRHYNGTLLRIDREAFSSVEENIEMYRNIKKIAQAEGVSPQTMVSELLLRAVKDCKKELNL